MFYGESQTRPWSQRELKAAARERAKARALEHDAEVRAAGYAAAEEAGKKALRSRMQRICGMPPTVTYRDFYTDDGEFTALELNVPRIAWQWVRLGFVPIAEDCWKRGRGWREGYRYCEFHNVRYGPDRAAKLLKSGPKTVDKLPDGRDYDGRPWW